MKAYLWISGVIFALFAAMHFVIAYEHWHRPASDPWSGLGPALMGIGGALTTGAFTLARSKSGPAA